ncbi:hypothetical protein F5148DRAFT_1149807 [Russula earlei]|uniref:Uncharacterized protein n=1 Tax=Russula earlei TaxID=71964 RepID=A0ACC0U6P4_9AGAM|nr:hypothetical protein F5148DRAFT_1149807 [Russula earlei]
MGFNRRVFTSLFFVLPSFLSLCPSHSHSSFPMIPVQDSQAASLLKISLANSQHGQDCGDDAAVKTHGVNTRHDQNGHKNASVKPRTCNSMARTAVMMQLSTLAMFLVGLQGDVLMAMTAALSHPLAPIPLQWRP